MLKAFTSHLCYFMLDVPTALTVALQRQCPTTMQRILVLPNAAISGLQIQKYVTHDSRSIQQQ